MIDVGYSGVIGAQRIVARRVAVRPHAGRGRACKACGPRRRGRRDPRPDPDERPLRVRERRAATRTGRSPTSAYMPGVPRSSAGAGKWDDAARGARDVDRLRPALRCSGSRSSGWRFGGPRLAATLAFAWAAYPFTQYASSSNTNDAIMPAFLDLGLLARDVAVRRAARSSRSPAGRSSRALLLAPLWGSYPGRAGARGRACLRSGLRGRDRSLRSRSCCSSRAPLHAARVFWDRTIGWQLGRDSPFSIWDWRQYHARGIPDLHLVQQRAARRCSSLGALACGASCRGARRRSSSPRSPRALLIGFELVLTHWFYLYIPWFFPFVAFVVLAAPRRRRARRSGAMTTLSASSSRPAEPASSRGGDARRAARCSWRRGALLHHGFFTHDQIIDTPVYERYGDGDRRRARCRTATSRSSIRRARCPVFVAACARRRGRRRRSAAGSSCGWRRSARDRDLPGGCARRARRGEAAWCRRRSGSPRSPSSLLGPVVLSRFDLWPGGADAPRRSLRSLAGRLPARAPRCSALRSRRSSTRPCSCRSRSSYVWRRAGGARRSSARGLLRRRRRRRRSCRSSCSPRTASGTASAVRLSRPLQIESLGAALLLAAHHAFGLGLDDGLEPRLAEPRAATGRTRSPSFSAVAAARRACSRLWIRVRPRPGRRASELRPLTPRRASCAFVALREGAVAAVPDLARSRSCRSSRGRRGAARVRCCSPPRSSLTQLWFPYRYWELRAALRRARVVARADRATSCSSRSSRARALPSRAANANGLAARSAAVEPSHSTSAPSRRTPPSAGSKPDRDPGPHALDRELGLDADHGVVRAGHARVGDRGRAARLDARVVRLHVRVRAEHGGHAAVEPAGQRDLLARRLGVEVDDDDRASRAAPPRRAASTISNGAHRGVEDRARRAG